MQTVIKVPNVNLLWRKSKFPLYHVSYVFNWREIWGSCWPGQLLYTTKSTMRRSSLMWTCVLLLKKYITFLSNKWPGMELTTCAIKRTLFIYPAETSYATASCNRWPPPHTMKPEVGSVWRGRMYSEKWRSPALHRTRVRPSLAYRRNLISWMKTAERSFTLQSTLSLHQSSHAWRYRGVSGLSGQRHTWSESCCKQTVPNGPWWHNRCNICPDFFPGCGHRCSLNASILTCVCSKWPSSTCSKGVGMFHRPLLKAPIHFDQQMHKSIKLSI